jgi:hypothetical protein
MISSRFAFAACLVAFFLAACGGSQPTTAATTAVQSATRPSEPSFHGYYSATFTEVVGGSLPFSYVCLQFMPSGAWRSVPSNTFDNGTYLISGNELFASAQAPWSPVIYASLQGSISGTQGSGDYIITQPTGAIYSGGTFTMTRAGKKHC